MVREMTSTLHQTGVKSEGGGGASQPPRGTEDDVEEQCDSETQRLLG